MFDIHAPAGGGLLVTDERKQRKKAYLAAMREYLESPPGAAERAARERVEAAWVAWSGVEHADA